MSSRPLLYPALCRCCRHIKRCRLLTAEYEFEQKKEVYSEMFLDCFGLVLSNLDVESECGICATCVMRLRDASAFHKQVLICEELLLTANLKRGIGKPNEPVIVKAEVASDHETKEDQEDDFVSIDNEDYETSNSHQEIKVEETTFTNSDLPVSTNSSDQTLIDKQEPMSKSEMKNNIKKLKAKLDALLGIRSTVHGASKITSSASMSEKLRQTRSIARGKAIRMIKNSSDLQGNQKVNQNLTPANNLGHNTNKDFDSGDDLPLIHEAKIVKPEKNEIFHSKLLEKKAKLENRRKEKIIVKKDKRMKCENNDVNGTSKVPMSKMQEMIREKDTSYMVENNVLNIVEFSFVCPFKCRHNHLLCYYCGQSFQDPVELRAHTQNEHSPKKFKIIEVKKMIKIDLTRIDCRLCAARIDSLEEFKKHLSVHDKKYYFDIKDSVLPFRLNKEDWKCAMCEEKFPYFHALNKHMNKHYSNYVCETCGLGFVDNARFVMHLQRHEQGDFPCETCSKVFKAQYNRDLHIDRVHNKRGRVYCPKCEIRLMSYSQKLKHLVEVHGETPLSFPCKLCDKVCDTRRMLTIHMRKDHLKDYRYGCSYCGQKFFTRFALKNHTPTHTGERNFKCKVCDKSYPRLKTLKDHMRIHTNDRRYRCHLCAQAFIQNCSLKNHLKSQHAGYG